MGHVCLIEVAWELQWNDMLVTTCGEEGMLLLRSGIF